MAAFGASKRTRIFKRDAIPFVEALDAGAYDIAFADPPYASRKADRIVKHWLEVPFAYILSVEHAADRPLPAGGKSHDFEETRVTIYRAPRRRGKK